MGRTVPLYFPGFCFLFVFVFGVFLFLFFFVSRFCVVSHIQLFSFFWCCVLIIRHATVNCILFARKRGHRL